METEETEIKNIDTRDNKHGDGRDRNRNNYRDKRDSNRNMESEETAIKM